MKWDAHICCITNRYYNNMISFVSSNFCFCLCLFVCFLQFGSNYIYRAQSSEWLITVKCSDCIGVFFLLYCWLIRVYKYKLCSKHLTGWFSRSLNSLSILVMFIFFLGVEGMFWWGWKFPIIRNFYFHLK